MPDVLYATRALGHASRGESPVAARSGRLTLTERPIDAAAHVRFAEDDPHVCGAIARQTGVAVRAENRSVHAHGLLGLRLGPGDWLVVATAGEGARAVAGMPADAPRWSIVDASDAWFRARVEGPGARDVIAEGCAVDLRHALAVDGTAVTRFARIRALVHRVAAESFDIHVERSHAAYLWTWLRGSMNDFL